MGGCCKDGEKNTVKDSERMLAPPRKVYQKFEELLAES